MSQVSDFYDDSYPSDSERPDEDIRFYTETAAERSWPELREELIRSSLYEPAPIVHSKAKFLSRFGSLVIVGGIVVVVTGVLFILAMGQGL